MSTPPDKEVKTDQDIEDNSRLEDESPNAPINPTDEIKELHSRCKRLMEKLYDVDPSLIMPDSTKTRETTIDELIERLNGISEHSKDNKTLITNLHSFLNKLLILDQIQDLEYSIDRQVVEFPSHIKKTRSLLSKQGQETPETAMTDYLKRLKIFMINKKLQKISKPDMKQDLYDNLTDEQFDILKQHLQVYNDAVSKLVWAKENPQNKDADISFPTLMSFEEFKQEASQHASGKSEEMLYVDYYKYSAEKYNNARVEFFKSNPEMSQQLANVYKNYGESRDASGGASDDRSKTFTTQSQHAGDEDDLETRTISMNVGKSSELLNAIKQDLLTNYPNDYNDSDFTFKEDKHHLSFTKTPEWNMTIPNKVRYSVSDPKPPSTEVTVKVKLLDYKDNEENKRHLSALKRNGLEPVTLKGTKADPNLKAILIAGKETGLHLKLQPNTATAVANALKNNNKFREGLVPNPFKTVDEVMDIVKTGELKPASAPAPSSGKTPQQSTGGSQNVQQTASQSTSSASSQQTRSGTPNQATGSKQQSSEDSGDEPTGKKHHGPS